MLFEKDYICCALHAIWRCGLVNENAFYLILCYSRYENAIFLARLGVNFAMFSHNEELNGDFVSCNNSDIRGFVFQRETNNIRI